ncbi:hypothetical protein HYFRA_00006088 [Hymenoscyphus fraxineus]|uniref:Rhodopsin domain-containing protein n=1 Tax=Hymenoscyphus fraxineus TaxID=746836 RepID=A0A9N9L9I0_9HELO|nr:hypothetical protein HYFRA_00006088 [Hymenoscyphus fraxineus]
MAVSDTGKTTSNVSVVLAVLAVLSVALRFWSRKAARVGYAADDWWILFATISMIAVGVVLLWGVRTDPNGGEFIDRDSPTFNYAPHTSYLKSAFISAILYFVVTTAIKISILLMYRRVFSVGSFRTHSLIVGALSVAWWLAGTIATIVSCIPIHRLWIGPSAGGYCFNFNIYWMAMGSVELLIDMAILILPIRMVLTLRLDRQHKILLVAIFLLGGFVIITGIVRVILGYKPGSQNVAFSKAELWSAVHIGVAIICASLPCLRPFLLLITRTASTIRSRLTGSSGSNSKHSGAGSSGNQQQGSGEASTGPANPKGRNSRVEALTLETMDHDMRVADTTGLTRASTRTNDLELGRASISSSRGTRPETGEKPVQRL